MSLTLREARALGERLKIFVQQNQASRGKHKYLDAIEGLVREMEARIASARTRQRNMHDCFGMCAPLMMLHHLQVPGMIKLQRVCHTQYSELT